MSPMNRLRTERQRLGLSLRDVQAATGIGISYVSALERSDRANPSLEVARRLARRYGVSVEYLFPSDDEGDAVDWWARYEVAVRDLEAAHERIEAVRRAVNGDNSG